MKQHSDTAWKIANLYSGVLASETRDLAAHIDDAIAAERKRCAEIAEGLAPVAAGNFFAARRDQSAKIAKAIRGHQQETRE